MRFRRLFESVGDRGADLAVMQSKGFPWQIGHQPIFHIVLLMLTWSFGGLFSS